MQSVLVTWNRTILLQSEYKLINAYNLLTLRQALQHHSFRQQLKFLWGDFPFLQGG